MKYFVIIVVAILIGAGAWFALRGKADVATGATTQPTAKVERRTLEKTITANGKVASNRDVDIKCQASGKVINLPFDISAKVKTGDLLLELDPVDQQRTVEQTKAQVAASSARVAQAEVNYKIAQLNLETTTQRVTAELASAKAKLEDAKSKANRTKQLVESKLASPEELETANTSATQAEAAVAQAQANQSELEQQKAALEVKKQDIETARAQLRQDQVRESIADLQLSYTKVFVPTDDASKTADYRISSLGTATSPVQVGTVVQSGSSGFSGGTTVMTLSDVSHMFVLASVDESDIGQIADPAWGLPAQKATVTVDAYPGERFEGEVVRVATKGVSTSNVVTFEVKIEITSANKPLLRPEMTATARVMCDSRDNVVAIPVAAFQLTEGQGERARRRSQESSTGPSTMPGMPEAAAGAGAATDGGEQPQLAEGQEPATRPAGRGRGRGGRGGGRGGRAATSLGTLLKVEPQQGTAQVVGADGSTQAREVTVGMSDGEFYEVLAGLEEGETVAVNKASAQSRWRGGGGGNNIMPRGMGGGGRGGR